MNLDKVPSNLEQALEILEGLAKEDKQYLKKEGSTSVHFGFGMWIRNNWSLWQKDTPLVLWFNKKGIYHADDMSGILLEAFTCKLQGKEYDIQKDIDRYRQHWINYGLDPDKIC